MEHLANEPLDWLNHTAVFAEDGAHRVWLSRQLSEGPIKPIIFIGHNPSKAGEIANDPTSRRAIAFTIALDGSHTVMVNPCSYVATDAKDIPVDAELACDLNWMAVDAAIKLARFHNGTLIACWGSPKGKAAVRRKIEDLCNRVQHYCREAGVTLTCLRHNPSGHPEHPLYLPGDLRPIPFIPVGA